MNVSLAAKGLLTVKGCGVLVMRGWHIGMLLAEGGTDLRWFSIHSLDVKYFLLTGVLLASGEMNLKCFSICSLVVGLIGVLQATPP